MDWVRRLVGKKDSKDKEKDKDKGKEKGKASPVTPQKGTTATPTHSPGAATVDQPKSRIAQWSDPASDSHKLVSKAQQTSAHPPVDHDDYNNTTRITLLVPLSIAHHN